MRIQILFLLGALLVGGCSSLPLALTAIAGTKNLIDDTNQDTEIEKLKERANHIEDVLNFHLQTVSEQCGMTQKVYVPSIFRDCKPSN